MTKINKEGWEIKKLGEVATIVSGATPKTNIPEYWGEGHFWITPAEIKEGDIEISKTERTITDEAVAHTNVNLLPEGTVLLSSRAPIGKVAIASVPMYCNQGFKNCICKESLHNKFLFYFLRCKNELLQSLGRGATFKEISKSIVEGIKIPLPPLPIQQRIVEELDEINAIITAKKLQLSKLDELAQSIFYNMFGDPVANEKGWKVSVWNDVLKIINGKNQKAVEAPNGQYPICGSGGIMGYAIDFLCPENTTIIGRKGNINKPIYMREKFWNVDTAFGLVADNTHLHPLFLFYFCVEFNFETLNKAVTIPSLTKADLLKINIPLPPLPLQEAFAARVTAIEEQKSSIAASIEKMQTLLDARMQEYFG